MALKYKIESGIVYVMFHGYVTIDDLRELAAVSSEIDEDSPDPLHRFIDFSNITGGNWNFDAMESFAAKQKLSGKPNAVRSAIFAPKPLQYGYARMYQQLHDHPGVDLQVFTNKELALEWLATGKRVVA